MGYEVLEVEDRELAHLWHTFFLVLRDFRQFDLVSIIGLDPLCIDGIEHLQRVAELLSHPGVVGAIGQPDTRVGVPPRIRSHSMAYVGRYVRFAENQNLG